jgi:hypothetical protein
MKIIPKLLIERKDLSLSQVVLLDMVQKNYPLQMPLLQC